MLQYRQAIQQPRALPTIKIPRASQRDARTLWGVELLKGKPLTERWLGTSCGEWE